LARLTDSVVEPVVITVIGNTAVPFANELERDLHFTKHGHKFGVSDAVQYERMADDFMFGTMRISMTECVRPNMIDRLRYNYSNRHFGVAGVTPPYVKTFYPVPFHTIAHYQVAANFFAHECGRTDL
jgi:hypothetical protein